MNENTIAAKTATMSARAKGPIKTIRDDSDKAIAASIWEREGQEGAVYYTYTLSRSYKSKTSGKEGYSGDFYGRNAKALANVAQLAEAWIAQRQLIPDGQQTA